MGTGVLGRTNQTFPPVWLSLAVPAEADQLAELVAAALASETVLDISRHPGLFGGFLRGTDARLMGAGGAEIARAADQDGAANLIHAHLIETLCSIGREYLDFYFLRIREPLEEFQIVGALEALEWARDEGHVKFVGLSAEAHPMVSLGAWQFHDAFEVILLPGPDSAYDGLRNLAKERRVGVIERNAPDAQFHIQTVRSVNEITEVLSVPASL